MKYFITGATGSVGSLIVDQLIKLDAKVIALTRNPEKSKLPKEVSLIQGNLTQGNFDISIFEGVESLFLFPAEVEIKPFLRNVKDAGVRNIVLLSSLAVSAHFQRDLNSASYKHHLLIENNVREFGFNLSVIRPGTFANNLLAWSPTIKMTKSVFLPFPDSKQAVLHEADIADCAVELLTKPKKRGKVYELSGNVALSQREQVAVIGKILGIPLNCYQITPEQFIESTNKYMSAEIIKMLLTYWEDTTLEPDPIRTGYVEITGRNGRSFEQWVDDHINQFR
jgi:uncharacterized protein YbjT (DUF2867 family)